MIPEEIEPRVFGAIRKLQAEIDDTEFCPRENFPAEKTLLVITSKALRIGLAVCQLVKAGFYGEAFGLTRSILEAFFVVKYIMAKDTDARAKSCLAFRNTYAYNQDQIRQKYFPQETRPTWLTQEMLDKVKTEVRHRCECANVDVMRCCLVHPIVVGQSVKSLSSLRIDIRRMIKVLSSHVVCRYPMSSVREFPE